MSEVTHVPLPSIRKGSLTKLWIGVAAIAGLASVAAFQQTGAQVAKAKPASEFLAENGKKAGVVTTASGLQYKIIKQGSGPKPGPNDVAVVHYTGRLTDGTEFDSTDKHGGKPAAFPVGQVIPGWSEGLQLMAKGSKFHFWIPSELAYGEQGAGGVIPPNATLEFDVELVDIMPGAGASQQAPAGGMEEGHDMGNMPQGGEMPAGHDMGGTAPKS